MNASMAPIGRPIAAPWNVMCPHTSATVLSIGRSLPSKRVGNSSRSHASNRLRRRPAVIFSMP